MNLLIDVNLGRKFTKLLNDSGYEAVFVNDLVRGASDEDILTLAKRVIGYSYKRQGLWRAYFQAGKILGRSYSFQNLCNQP